MGSLQQVLVTCKPGGKQKKTAGAIPQIIQQNITGLLNAAVSKELGTENIATHRIHVSHRTSSRFAENFFRFEQECVKQQQTTYLPSLFKVDG